MKENKKLMLVLVAVAVFAVAGCKPLPAPQEEDYKSYPYVVPPKNGRLLVIPGTTMMFYVFPDPTVPVKITSPSVRHVCVEGLLNSVTVKESFITEDITEKEVTVKLGGPVKKKWCGEADVLSFEVAGR